ncbi:MAG: hypothetical protein ACJ8BW_37805 [Ktedonobacteraceae bacterium]
MHSVVHVNLHCRVASSHLHRPRANVERDVHFKKELDFLIYMRRLAAGVKPWQDVLKSAIDRSDQRIIKLALRKALSDQQAREKHVHYLIEHRDLLATDWLTRETVAIALSNFDADAAKVCADLLCTLLGKALDNDEFPRAKIMITEIFAALTHAIPWTEAHGELLSLVGFTIWKIGEPEKYTRRFKSGVDELLNGVKEHFFKQLGDIWKPLKDAQSLNGVECFAGVLNKLIVETTTINDLVHEVTEYRFCHGYLKLQKIEEIRESLKQAVQEVYNLSASDYERGKVHGAADNLFIDLAVMLAELGESKETLYSFLSNLKTGNRAVHIRQKMLGPQPHKHPWLKEESYQTAIYGAFYSVRHTATGFSS